MTTLASRVAILPIVLAAAGASGQATFQGLGFLTGNQFGHSSEAMGVPGDGSAVVGFSTSIYAKEPFRWTAAAGMTGLGFASTARAVSANGKVVVGDDQSNGFSWTDPKNGGQGKVNIADLPGGFVGTLAYGASTDGKYVVGQSSSMYGFEAFRWTKAGGSVGLGDLPGGSFDSAALGVSGNGGVVVGYGTNSHNAYEAFRWTPAGGMVALGDLPGGASTSTALGISADGKAIVGWGTSAQGKEAFRWTSASGMVGLGDLPGGSFASQARAASSDGSVIVGQAAGASGDTAFVWTQAAGMVSLQELLTSQGADLTGWTLRRANAVSADGLTIVGMGDHSGRLEAFIATVSAGGNGCYADFTGDGALDLFDFLAFVNAFNAVDPSADCDHSGSLDLFDFLCFTNGFNTGCP